MTTPRHILAATDLSAPARHAVERAALIAAASGAALDLLHVLESGPMSVLRELFGVSEGDLDERIKSQARDTLHQFAAELVEHTGVAPGVLITEGRLLDEIAARADALDAGLLVLGAQGANFVRHWALGSTTERLLRKTRRPMLVVRAAPRVAYGDVLVAVDLSDWSGAIIALANAVASAARLCLLHVYQVPYESNLRLAGVPEDTIAQHRASARYFAEEDLRRLATEAGLTPGSYRTLCVHGLAAMGILEQAEELGTDLIVIGKHGQGMAEELLLGSVSKHVLAEARCDVLIAQKQAIA